MIIVKENFTDFDSIKKNWHWKPPWGEGDHKKGLYSEYRNMKIIEGEGLVMMATQMPQSSSNFLMPRLFWKGAPMGYGKYTAFMKVQKCRAVGTFVLYTNAHYRQGVRTILPEIDIAEYGLKNNPTVLNVAVHRRARNPAFVNDPRYLDYKDRHELDYLWHPHKSKQFPWPDKPRWVEHSCEVTPKKIDILIDGKKVFTDWNILGHFTDSFNPTFGQPIPDWIREPLPAPMFIKNFTYEY